MIELPLRQVRGVTGINLRTLTVVNLVFSVQLLVLIVYTLVTEVTVPGIRYLVIPFIWINASIWVIVRATPERRGKTHTAIAVSIAAAYFVLLLYLSGGLRPSSLALATVTGPDSFDVTWRSLGWGPTLLYSGGRLSLVLIPYQVVGYVALAYLLYVAILDITKGAFGGVVGLFPCPGCAAPLWTPVFASALGTTSGFLLLVSYSYEIATLLFLISLWILYRRPTLRNLQN